MLHSVARLGLTCRETEQASNIWRGLRRDAFGESVASVIAQEQAVGWVPDATTLSHEQVQEAHRPALLDWGAGGIMTDYLDLLLNGN